MSRDKFQYQNHPRRDAIDIAPVCAHVVLIDRAPDLHIPHLLPPNRILLLGIRLGLSFAILESVQLLHHDT